MRGNDFNAVTLKKINRETSAAAEYGPNDPVTTTPNGECAIANQTASTPKVACESDAAGGTLSFDSEGDPGIQSTTVSVKSRGFLLERSRVERFCGAVLVRDGGSFASDQ